LFGLFILLRLVSCDEELCYRIAFALSCHLFFMSVGGGFECADLEYQVVDLYDPSCSVHSLHPAHVLRPLMEVREFGNLALGHVLGPRQLVMKVVDQNLISLRSLDSPTGLG
jgi:hypothetical protein